MPLCVLMLAGCASHAAQQPPQPARPAQAGDETGPGDAHCREEGRVGTTVLGSAVGCKLWSGRCHRKCCQTSVAREVRSYCPRFATLGDADKRAFWAYTFQALAGAEAGLKPTTNVRHTEPEVAVKDTVSKRTVRQEGLLQLTYMDATRYGCDFDWEHDKTLPEKDPAKTILQPRNNLLCGVKILENQIVTQRKPLLTPSSYWVTLRPATPSYLVFAKQMKNVPRACRVGTPPVEEAKRRRPVNVPEAAVAAPGHGSAAANSSP